MYSLCSCEKFNLNHMSLQDPRHFTSSQLHLNLGHDLTVLNTLKISAHRGDPQFDGVTANSERLELVKISITVSGEN